MRILSHDFTTPEKIVLAVLGIILVVLAYYKLVDEPVRTQKAEAQAEQAVLQTELASVQAEVSRLRRMEEELSRTDRSVDVMAPYNNSKQEIAFMNNVLGSTNTRFSLAFANVTRSGDQIRRDFTLQFTAPDYETARQAVYRITHGTYRCILGDLTYSVNNEGLASLDTSGRFYETLVGGTPDVALPDHDTFGG